MSAAPTPAAKFAAPAAGKGQVVYEWNTDCTAPIICHLDYEPASGDGWNEPRCNESLSLVAAYVHGADIYELLSYEQVTRIEEMALMGAIDSHQAAKEEAAEERAQFAIEAAYIEHRRAA